MNEPVINKNIGVQSDIQKLLSHKKIQCLFRFAKAKQTPIWVLCFALVAATLLHIPLSVFPLGRDQGVWTTAGMAMDLGYTFFKDLMHFNLPGLGISYWAIFQFIDNPQVATMLLSLFGSLTILIGIYLLLRLCVSNTVAMIAVVMFAIRWPTVINYWNIAQKDYLAMAGVLWGTWLLARANSHSSFRSVSIYLSGFAIGIAIMYKPVFAIAGILLAISHWLRSADFNQHRGLGLSIAGLKRILVDYFLLALGPASVLLAFAFYLHQGDALQNAYNGIFIFAPGYAGIFSHNLFQLLALLIFHALLLDYSEHPLWAFFVLLAWLPSVVIGGYALFRKKFGTTPQWLYIPLVTSVFTFIIQSKGFPYHAQPWQICLFFLSATGITWLWYRVIELQPQFKSRRFILTTFVTVGLALLLFARPLTISNYARVTVPAWFGLIPREEYLTEHYEPKDSPNPQISEEIALWIQQNTTPDDKILVWGLECQLYSLSNRMFATSSPFDVILSTNDLKTQSAIEWQKAERAKFVEQLKTSLPKYILITSQDENPVEPVSSKDAMVFVPGFSEVLANKYFKLNDWERFEIYQLKGV
ncbi:MAG: hypothetical protein MI976_05060 [Pseudomonadales bacterium]|nr:hypothetical protein [Pseudomonadales bacterium]